MYELITALFLAMLTIKFVDFELSNDKFSDDEKEKYRDFIGTFSGIVSVNILLPVIFMESIYTNVSSRKIYLGTVIFGFLFAIVTFCVAYTISKKIMPERNKRWSDIATATFGGGNRGILLLTSSFLVLEQLGINYGTKNEYLTFFYAFDLGNFISFFVLISTIVRNRGMAVEEYQLAKLSSAKSIATDFLIKLGLPGILLSLGIFIMTLASMYGWPNYIIEFIKSTSNGRKFMLLYFALIATLLHIKLKTQGGAAMYDLGFLMLVRTITATSFLLLLSQFVSGEIIKVLAHPSSVAIIILSLCPPSSLLPAQIEKLGKSKYALAAVSNLSLLSNVFFFAILGMITVLTLVLKLT